MSWITEFIASRMEDPSTRSNKQEEYLRMKLKKAEQLKEQWREPARPPQYWKLHSSRLHYDQQLEMAGVGITKYTVFSHESRANSWQSVLEMNEKQGEEGLR